MTDFGTIALDRGIFKHPAFPDEPFTAREAWVWMIVSAAQKPGERRVGRHIVALKRGQLAYSNRFMAERWKWSISKVQRFLAKLASSSFAMIEYEVTESGVTRVTLLNYDKFPHPVPASVAESVTEFATVLAASQKIESDLNRSQDHTSDCGDNKNRDGPTSIESTTGLVVNQITENQPTDSESVVVGGDARAREEKYITAEAIKLADEIMLTFGIDLKFVPPGWCGAPMWLQAGLNSGWRPEIVLVAAAKIRARRNFQPPYSFTYLAKPIHREHEIWAPPNLPLPPTLAADNKDAGHARKSHGNNWQQARDDFRSARAELKAKLHDATTDAGSGDGGQVVRFAPPARRG